jgi:hypothetical protein
VRLFNFADKIEGGQVMNICIIVHSKTGTTMSFGEHIADILCKSGHTVAYSGANWTVIPDETGHQFRMKVDTRSGGNWTPIPA